MLTSADKKFRGDLGDVGPVFDVVSYFDGDLWHVLVRVELVCFLIFLEIRGNLSKFGFT